MVKVEFYAFDDPMSKINQIRSSKSTCNICKKKLKKKSFSGCINYFKSNPKIRRDSAINGKYGSTKHET